MGGLRTFKYSLDPVFIHEGLLLNLLTEFEKEQFGNERRILASRYQHNMLDQANRAHSCDWLLKVLGSEDVKSLEILLLEERQLREGQLVWIEDSIVFSGIKSYKRNPAGGYMTGIGNFHVKLENFTSIELMGRLNIAHVVSDSAFLRLSGRHRCFMFGYLQSTSNERLEIRAIFIGGRIFRTDIPMFHLDTDALYTTPEAIDDFSKITNVGRRSVRLADAQFISEAKIKQWIAEIIAEDHIPKDWAGERSDLYSNHISIGGERKRAAFLLKGPSKFHPMTIRDLGKGANQIHRLYTEDADIYILQHCHKVTSEVYQMMRVYSSQFNRIRPFCVVDGIDTLRLFKAYGKI